MADFRNPLSRDSCFQLIFLYAGLHEQLHSTLCVGLILSLCVKIYCNRGYTRDHLEIGAK